MVVLLTGHAGFIGFHLAKKLLSMGIVVIGIDNLNPYYDVNLKKARLDQLLPFAHFTHYECDISDAPQIADIFERHKPTHVIHLAAQAGVRHSIDHPTDYIQSNIVGFFTILDQARKAKVNHFIFASSSSVYGSNCEIPFNESDTTDHPLNLYGATKKSNEVMAHAYSALYQLPVTGLRFFTVYGPWGRPDMALFKFTQSIYDHENLQVFSNGTSVRDFTYIDDIVEGITRLLDHLPHPSPTSKINDLSHQSSVAPYKIYNIGRGEPQKLIDFINALEDETGMLAFKDLLPHQPGDSPITSASTTNLFDAIGYRPRVSIKDGIKAFVAWYKDFYKVSNPDLADYS